MMEVSNPETLSAPASANRHYGYQYPALIDILFVFQNLYRYPYSTRNMKIENIIA